MGAPILFIPLIPVNSYLKTNRQDHQRSCNSDCDGQQASRKFVAAMTDVN